MNLVDDIKLFVKRGYSNNEIREILDVSDDDINNIRLSYMKIDSPSIDTRFSKTCINVFCKFLNQGISDEQLYDLFCLRRKCKREEFYSLCQKLRKGKIYTDITSQYNIPLEPTVVLDLSKFKTSKSSNPKSLKISEDSAKERREIARKKREKEKASIAAAVARKEKEDLEQAERNKKIAETKKEKQSKPITPIVTRPAEEIIDNIYETEPLPVLDTSPQNVPSDDKIHRVCNLLNDGYTYDEIQKLTQIPASTVARIHNGEAYKDISIKYGILSKSTKNKLREVLKEIEV